MSRVVFGKNAEQDKWFRLDSLLQEIAAHQASHPSTVPGDAGIDPHNSASDRSGVISLSSEHFPIAACASSRRLTTR